MVTKGPDGAPDLRIRRRHLDYVPRLGHRDPETVDLVVIHCTELPDLPAARRFGEKIHYAQSATGNSGHYYIDRDGSVEEWVPPERVAHHVRNFNARSVGIELVNRGRYPDWFDSRRQDPEESYVQEQIEALLKLLRKLNGALPNLAWVAGHEQLDRSRVQASDDPARSVLRKRDPGPLFPWPTVLDRCGLKWLELPPDAWT